MSSILIILGLILTLVFPAAAQDAVSDEHPLLQMLALAPDTANARSSLSYTDYRAMEAARGLTSLTEDDFNNRTDDSGLWIAAANGLSSGMRLDHFLSYLEGMKALVGFSFFDIDRALVFGQPPGMGTILTGNFDAQQIDIAYRARDFMQTEINGVPVWCGPDGCDSGLQANLRDRDPANPFGGDLGRSEPLALLPDALADSPDLTVLESIIVAFQDSEDSLIAVPDYRAAAEAVTQSGSLIQAIFINPADILVFDMNLAGLLEEDAPPLDPAEFGTLPPYSLAILADVVDESSQVALVGLVYNDAETAQAAAEELIQRYSTITSIAAHEPYLSLLEERGGKIGTPEVYTSAETGKSVALIPFEYPLPSNEPGEDGRYIASGLVFRLLYQQFIQRDVLWLASQIIPPVK